jgi:hypothetical protein
VTHSEALEEVQAVGGKCLGRALPVRQPAADVLGGREGNAGGGFQSRLTLKTGVM